MTLSTSYGIPNDDRVVKLLHDAGSIGKSVCSDEEIDVFRKPVYEEIYGKVFIRRLFYPLLRCQERSH